MVKAFKLLDCFGQGGGSVVPTRKLDWTEYISIFAVMAGRGSDLTAAHF